MPANVIIRLNDYQNVVYNQRGQARLDTVTASGFHRRELTREEAEQLWIGEREIARLELARQRDDLVMAGIVRNTPDTIGIWTQAGPVPPGDLPASNNIADELNRITIEQLAINQPFGRVEESKVCPGCNQPRPAHSYLTHRGHRCHYPAGRRVRRCHICRSQQSAKAAQTRRVRAAASGTYWSERAQQRALKLLGLLAIRRRKDRPKLPCTEFEMGSAPSLHGPAKKVGRYKNYMRTVAGIKRPSPRAPAGMSRTEIGELYREFMAGRVSREEYERPLEPTESTARLAQPYRPAQAEAHISEAGFYPADEIQRILDEVIAEANG